MKLTSDQNQVLASIVSVIHDNRYDDTEGSFVDTIFTDDLVSAIKHHFKTGNVGAFERYSGMKPSNVQYVISVLKKCGYKVKYESKVWVDDDYHAVYTIEKR
jgi:hypothetical protein